MVVRVFICCALMFSASHAADGKYLAAILELLTQRFPDNRTVTIVAHGHSVPAGYGATPTVRPFDAYPHLLHVVLQDKYPTAVISIVVTAIGGETSEVGAARFLDVIKLRPDVVIIDYALNDRSIGLDRAEKAWVSMITSAQLAGAKVILLTPTPDIEAQIDNQNDPINLHAKQIIRLALKYNVPFVDSLALFKASGKTLQSLMAQSNHPSRAGHELVATALASLF